MKFSRYFLPIFVLALLVVVVSANIADVDIDETQDGKRPRNPLLEEAIRIIKKAIVRAVKNCIVEAAKNCREYWETPKQLVACARIFLRENQGRCVVG